MRPYRFCPDDGAALEEVDGEGGSRCPSCGRSWYRNPAPTVGAAIVKGGRALIAERARQPKRGRYDVPGGFIDTDEHPVEGLKREVREELALEIEVSVEDCVSMVPHRYGDDGVAVLALGFKAQLVGAGEPRPADDVASVRWVATDELDAVDFAWPHDRELVRRALKDAAAGG